MALLVEGRRAKPIILSNYTLNKTHKHKHMNRSEKKDERLPDNTMDVGIMISTSTQPPPSLLFPILFSILYAFCLLLLLL